MSWYQEWATDGNTICVGTDGDGLLYVQSSEKYGDVAYVRMDDAKTLDELAQCFATLAAHAKAHSTRPTKS